MELPLRDLDLIDGGSSQPTATRRFGYAVVVLDRGFVYVGDAERDGDMLNIGGARNIRYWGTESGLAQLVTGGPTSKTKLDAAHDLSAPWRAVISIHPTERRLWA